MAERFGAIVSPATAPDPGLSSILAYLKAYLNAKEATAWAALAPGKLPVLGTFAHAPEERSFNEATLPALYLTRRRGRFFESAAGLNMVEDELRLLWVMPQQPQARQVPRDPMVARVARAVTVALRKCAIPEWVAAADLADVDAFRLSAATLTTAASYAGSDLDGVVGAGPLSSPRYVTATATAAVGAYSLSPIVVEGWSGDTFTTDTLTPLSTGGGWTLTGTVAFTQVTRLAVPAQALTTGALSFGHTEDAVAVVRGSLLATHAGFETCRVTTWEAVPLPIPIKGDDARNYEAVAITLLSTEQHTTDFEDDADELVDEHWRINVASSEGDGVVPMMDRETST